MVPARHKRSRRSCENRERMEEASVSVFRLLVVCSRRSPLACPRASQHLTPAHMWRSHPHHAPAAAPRVDAPGAAAVAGVAGTGTAPPRPPPGVAAAAPRSTPPGAGVLAGVAIGAPPRPCDTAARKSGTSRAGRQSAIPSCPKKARKGKTSVFVIVDVSCQLSACLHEQLISLRRVHVIGTPRASRALGGARPARGGGCQVGQHLRLPRPVQRAPCDLRESALRGAVGGARAHASKTPCAGRACAPPGPRAPTRTFHTSESKVSEPMRRLARTTRKLTGPRSVPLASA